ncbi:hypothetical protein E1B28_000347 [Marasmius oreades]|uniref:Uncharacterized protein n=1 Tax=Marasmius oreades TaxID=181124 RepID=A0A9P7V176_9AGAR|nr:uncharacterized protein E1B28_000347 [Marasmius oreades]KAG7098389.1 hypothetical protein E1B28_000347 [Marasmius oreades]
MKDISEENPPSPVTISLVDGDGTVIVLAGSLDSDCNFTPRTDSTSSSSSLTISASTVLNSVTPMASTVSRLNTQTGPVTTQSLSSRSSSQSPPATTDSRTTMPASLESASRSRHQLGTGAIVGIVLGVIVAILLVALTLCLLWRQSRKRKTMENSELSAVPWTSSSAVLATVGSTTLASTLAKTASTQPLGQVEEMKSEIVNRSSPPPPLPPSSDTASSPRTSLPLYQSPQLGDELGSSSEREIFLQRQVDMLLSENVRLAGQLHPPPAYHSS